MKAMTRSQRKQGGLSTVGWLGVVAIFGLLVVSFFKVFPFYYDNFKLQSALEAVAQDPEVDPRSKRAIWESLQKRLFVNDVKSVKRENVTMVRKNGATTITVTYEASDDY